MVNIEKEDGLKLFSLFYKTSNYWILENKKNYKRKDNISRKEQVIIKIYNKILYNYLVNNDYKEKFFKSPDKILSVIKYKNYWLRGYFDGDGCLNVRKRKNTFNCCLSFSSNINQNWNFLIKIMEKLNLKSFKIIKRRKNYGSCSIFKSESIIESKKILILIYKNFEIDNIGLLRKYKKFIVLNNYKLLKKSKYE